MYSSSKFPINTAYYNFVNLLPFWLEIKKKSHRYFNLLFTYSQALRNRVVQYIPALVPYAVHRSRSGRWTCS